MIPAGSSASETRCGAPSGRGLVQALGEVPGLAQLLAEPVAVEAQVQDPRQSHLGAEVAHRDPELDRGVPAIVPDARRAELHACVLLRRGHAVPVLPHPVVPAVRLAERLIAIDAILGEERRNAVRILLLPRPTVFLDPCLQ